MGYRSSGVRGSGDCDDNDNTVYPGAFERCDGKDNNCNGQTDENGEIAFYKDVDGDGFGDPGNSKMACSQPQGYVENDGDCNDSDPAVHEQSWYYQDNDGDGFGDPANSIPACNRPEGFVTNSSDCNDNDASVNFNTTWWLDADNDGYYKGSGITQCNTPGPGYRTSGLTGGNDCDDNDNTVYPGAPELCDGKDNNCNNQSDEAGQTIFYKDNDGDGFGNAGNKLLACSQPAGFVSNNTDCNDNDNTIYPGAPERCDGKDNNCNGQTDEGAKKNYYRDKDKDGYGDPLVFTNACTAPTGYVLTNTDCNDNDKTIYPGAPELCDGKDNNCNGQKDEGTKKNYYRDKDKDGFGDPLLFTSTCVAPSGYVLNNTDCNDNDKTIYPGAPELCDGKDNNCNGQTDEGVKKTYFRDRDGDGYGDPAVSTTACSAPPGYVSKTGDCKDNNRFINPGAGEICGNGVDDNCNGQVDEMTLSGLITTNIESGSAKLNWYSSVTPLLWQIDYKKANSSVWMTLVLTGNSKSRTISSLSSGQTYNWRIRSLCGNDWIAYSATQDFKTSTGKKSNQEAGGSLSKTIQLQQEGEESLEITALPNPADNYFNLFVKGDIANGRIRLRVTDIYGRVIEQREHLVQGEMIKIGEKFIAGIYFVEVQQGVVRKTIKLVKQ